MGMHRNIPEPLLRDRAAREHRVRIWWTAYMFDRTWASKLGHPVSVHDDDFDVDAPNSDGLADHEDFGDPEFILRNIELARLTGRIIPSIYGQRRERESFSHRVQQALTDLTCWVESLPSHLQLHESEDGITSPSNVIYLHLTFNQVRARILNLQRVAYQPASASFWQQDPFCSISPAEKTKTRRTRTVGHQFPCQKVLERSPKHVFSAHDILFAS
jgi:hypothetical protein